jgi:hypothetical protein
LDEIGLDFVHRLAKGIIVGSLPIGRADALTDIGSLSKYPSKQAAGSI